MSSVIVEIASDGTLVTRPSTPLPFAENTIVHVVLDPRKLNSVMNLKAETKEMLKSNVNVIPYVLLPSSTSSPASMILAETSIQSLAVIGMVCDLEKIKSTFCVIRLDDWTATGDAIIHALHAAQKRVYPSEESDAMLDFYVPLVELTPTDDDEEFQDPNMVSAGSSRFESAVYRYRAFCHWPIGIGVEESEVMPAINDLVMPLLQDATQTLPALPPTHNPLPTGAVLPTDLRPSVVAFNSEAAARFHLQLGQPVLACPASLPSPDEAPTLKNPGLATVLPTLFAANPPASKKCCQFQFCRSDLTPKPVQDYAQACLCTHCDVEVDKAESFNVYRCEKCDKRDEGNNGKGEWMPYPAEPVYPVCQACYDLVEEDPEITLKGADGTHLLAMIEMSDLRPAPGAMDCVALELCSKYRETCPDRILAAVLVCENYEALASCPWMLLAMCQLVENADVVIFCTYDEVSQVKSFFFGTMCEDEYMGMVLAMQCIPFPRLHFFTFSSAMGQELDDAANLVCAVTVGPEGKGSELPREKFTPGLANAANPTVSRFVLQDKEFNALIERSILSKNGDSASLIMPGGLLMRLINSWRSVHWNKHDKEGAPLSTHGSFFKSEFNYGEEDYVNDCVDNTSDLGCEIDQYLFGAASGHVLEAPEGWE